MSAMRSRSASEARSSVTGAGSVCFSRSTTAAYPNAIDRDYPSFEPVENVCGPPD
jgi:hypothetical protein